ncbi:MAG: helix-turn-helix transcriptional regulator [Humibacillus sp.]|nr:helix-turn-helix transcriptional regulator [Humibacillus sp.]MDN5777428.1 helix-turn-helix transcriptional regulator [Humibacillus sp.]
MSKPSAPREGVDDVSALAATLLTLGDQWNLMILHSAFLHHSRRFAQWVERLGISESVLADRIRELVAAGILESVPYRTRTRAREEYWLTESGLALWSVLVSIWAWDETWAPGRATDPVRLVHRDCDGAALPLLACAACGVRDVTARDTWTETLSAEAVVAGSRRRHHRKTSRRPLDVAASFDPQTLDILGDRWSTLLLATALLGARRFSDFRERLGIAQSVLSGRLRLFVDHGVFEAQPTPGQRGHEYRLTQKGLDFFGVFTQLVAWSRAGHSPGRGDDLIIYHRACGYEFVPLLLCGACQQPLTRPSIRFEPEAATR